MKRREFIALATATAAGAISGPLSALAQERWRRIGVLMNSRASDAYGQSRFASLLQGLQEFGWSVGRNASVDVRWGGGEPDSFARLAAELLKASPDVVVTSGGTATRAMQQASRTVPIVFINVTDPVGGGVIASLAQPGGNTTGFTQSEFGISAKWLELLKEIAPHVTRVGVLRDPTNPAGIGQFAAMQSVAPALGVELSPINVRDTGEIKTAISTFARQPNGGLVVVTGGLARRNREVIVALAAEHRLPAVYPLSVWALEGGLASFGSDPFDPYRRAASYVDRILKGEKPNELAVQTPTKFATVINLKTAKALGLTVSPALLARADEVIE